MIAPSAGERKMRGVALPLCARGVSVPTSTKPKPMREKLTRHARILVETRRHTERIGKVEAKDALRQALIVRACGAGIEPEFERFYGEVVGALRVERLEQGLAQAEQRVHAKRSPSHF